jgi:hypothetical protein
MVITSYKGGLDLPTAGRGWQTVGLIAALPCNSFFLLARSIGRNAFNTGFLLVDVIRNFE